MLNPFRLPKAKPHVLGDVSLVPWNCSLAAESGGNLAAIPRGRALRLWRCRTQLWWRGAAISLALDSESRALVLSSAVYLE